MRVTSMASSAVKSILFASCAAFGTGRASQAQVGADTIRCDSIIAAARLDSVPARLFVAATRMDGPDLSASQREKLLSNIVASFLPPVPFRLTVFGGGVQMRALRSREAGRHADPRAPVVTGRYRVYASKNGDSLRIALVRASMMPGFDDAALDAIRSLKGTGALAPPLGLDSMIVDIRFTSESRPDARQFVEAFFPRMPVVDAMPALDNPLPRFPEDERADGAIAGEVVFALVIDRSGSPAMETVEVVRGSSMSFVREALRVLPQQRFTPATIQGCAAAQEIEYPMTFVLPAAAPDTSRGHIGASRGGIDGGATASP